MFQKDQIVGFRTGDFTLVSPQMYVALKGRIFPSCVTGILFKINAGVPGKGVYGFKFKVGAGTYLIRSAVLLQTT